ncbi:MAG: hypothetical protein RL219_619 [Actinomycetota bacterium]|jgi:uncharacterized protein (TIGR03083 family)
MANDDITPEQYGTEYAASRQRIRGIIERASSGPSTVAGLAGTIIPACPDWSVTNILAHLAGVTRDIVERRNPGPDVQAWVDGQVADRAARSLPSLLDEWDEFAPRFEALIASHPRAFSGLVLDVVAHEHDICSAIGIVGDRASSGVRAAMLVEARQILDRDLPRAGLGAVRVVADGEEWICGTGSVGLSLDLGDLPHGTWELTRILGSRRSLRQMRTYAWQGDLDAYLPGIAHMPLPDSDLVE